VIHANRPGLLQDGNMAVYWYGLASYLGHALARHNLGAMIDSGRAAVRDTMR
jgi:TPR repeat protein